MKIIIAGDGKVGLALTRLLSEEGHDLVTIDTNREVLERSAQLYDVMAVVGNCATMATLREANVEQADLLIAATSADEINLLCCLTARKLNPSLHTIASRAQPGVPRAALPDAGGLRPFHADQPGARGGEGDLPPFEDPGLFKARDLCEGARRDRRAARAREQPA